MTACTIQIEQFNLEKFNKKSKNGKSHKMTLFCQKSIAIYKYIISASNMATYSEDKEFYCVTTFKCTNI